jgi:hypothetical protein
MGLFYLERGTLSRLNTGFSMNPKIGAKTQTDPKKQHRKYSTTLKGLESFIFLLTPI